MKRFKNKITIMLLVFLGAIFASTQNTAYATVEVPTLPMNNIYDSSNYLTDSTKEMLHQYNQEQNTKIAIYMIESLGTESIEDVSKEIAKKWNIGEGTNTDSILIVFTEDNNEFRFSLSENLSVKISKDRLKNIFATNKKYLEKSDYDNAIFNVVKSFEEEIENQKNKASQTYSVESYNKQQRDLLYNIILISLGLLLILVLLAFYMIIL